MFLKKLRSGIIIRIFIILLLYILTSPLVIPSVIMAESGGGAELPSEIPPLSIEACSIPTDSSSVRINEGEADQDDPSILEFIEDLF